MTWVLEGHVLVGPAHIVCRGVEGVTIFVVRYAGPGRGWMRFVRRIGRGGWHVTCHRTKRAATER